MRILKREKMNYNFHTGTIINYFVQVQIMPELPAAAAVLVPAILERLEPLRPQQVLAVDPVAIPHHHRLLAGLPGPQIQTRLSHPRGPCHEGKTITKLQIQNEVLPTFSSRSVQSRFLWFFLCLPQNNSWLRPSHNITCLLVLLRIPEQCQQKYPKNF